MQSSRGLFAALVAITILGGCSGGGSGQSPPTATQLSVSPASGSVLSGAVLSVTVQAIDASNTLVPGFSGTLEMSSSDPNAILPGPQSFSGGKVTFLVAFNTPGKQTVSVSSGSLTGTSPAIMVIVPLAIATTALPNGVTGTPYSTPIQATGGVAPFTWTIVKGTPPHGLMLSSSDTETVNLAGNPDTVSQSVAFTIQIADSAQNTAIQVYTISIVSQASTLQLSPPSLDFGNELVGSTSGVLTETLTNTATPAVSITAIAIQPGSTDFSVVSNTCPSLLPSLASCVIGVTFKPTQSGPQSTILNITDDTEASPQEVVLGGIGLTSGPNATVYPAIVYLGIQLVGTTSPSRPITVTNYGAATLNVSSITASSNFDETDDCVGSVPSLGSCTIHVGFAPGTEGVLDGSVTIADDAPGSPQTVALTGTGSTTTPLLTGYCAYATSLCGVREAVDSGQCPQGVRSDHPWSIAVCPVGPARGQGFPVDGQRPCQTATGQGFCATQPP